MTLDLERIVLVISATLFRVEKSPSESFAEERATGREQG
jgi:hypothetical protein